jgi:hypothetical protein
MAEASGKGSRSKRRDQGASGRASLPPGVRSIPAAPSPYHHGGGGQANTRRRGEAPFGARVARHRFGFGRPRTAPRKQDAAKGGENVGGRVTGPWPTRLASQDLRHWRPITGGWRPLGPLPCEWPSGPLDTRSRPSMALFGPRRRGRQEGIRNNLRPVVERRRGSAIVLFPVGPTSRIISLIRNGLAPLRQHA